MIAALVALAVAGAPGVDVAKRTEARAFADVDAHRWCDAMALFLEANDQAPAPGLLLDAAHAAELAGDRRRAAALYGSVDDAGAANRRATLLRTIAREGPGTSCAGGTVTAADDHTPDARAPDVAPPPDDEAGARDDGAAAVDAHAGRGKHHARHRRRHPRPVDAHRVEQAPPSNGPWGFAALGAGGAGMLVGVVLVGVGGEPWVASSTAPEGSAGRAQRSSGAYRFDAYGKGVLAGGGALLAASAVALAGGAVLLRGEE